jgi:hypothetical protein
MSGQNFRNKKIAIKKYRKKEITITNNTKRPAEITYD